MTTTTDPTASSQTQPAVAAAIESRPDLAEFIVGYFRHVDEHDQPRQARDVVAMVQAHRRTGAVRQPGQILIRPYNPPSGGDGWSGTSTVIDIVNDDMPYLVDTVVGTLTSAGITVHRVLHPILAVRREPDGRLAEVCGESIWGADPAGSLRESWMHLLVDRLTDAARAEAIEEELRSALSLVRTVVQDAAALTGTARQVAAELRGGLRPTPAGTEAADLLDWFAAGNMTFLGYRRRALGPQHGFGPGSVGLGMLRDSGTAEPGADVRASGDTGTPIADRTAADGAVRNGGPAAGGTGVRSDAGATAGSPTAGSPAAGPTAGSPTAGSPTAGPTAGSLTAASATAAPGPNLVTISQLFLSTAMSRETPALSVSVKVLGPDGRPSADHTFLGVLTPQARNSDVTTTPVLRQVVREVFETLGATPDSYSGQRATELLATYPRAEMFWASREQILDVVSGQLQLASRRRLRVFLQPDPQGHFMSALVFLPRDRYTTDRRLAMQQVLVEALGGTDIRYAARIGESQLAAVHFTVTTDPRHPVRMDRTALAALTARLRETTRSWDDRLVSAVLGGEEDLDTATALSRYGTAFDEAYKEDYTVEDAVADLRRLDELTGPTDLALAIIVPPDAQPGEYRLKLYVTGTVVTLSRALPVLQQMGTEIIDERPYEVRRTDGTPAHIYDFGLRLPVDRLPHDSAGLEDLRGRFSDAFIATWRGRAEVDGFNALVLAAGLQWRDIAVLRAYAKYLRQIGSAYTQGYLEQVLAAYPGITSDLAALFRARFGPNSDGDARAASCGELTDRITGELDAVSSLDADRILRTYLRLILATDRTNAFRRDPDGELRQCLSFKLDPHRIPGVPKPVPAHEIWVYSPRVEGVHLRFGPVARGGLRWSDRPEDFRTEILGLVKAQEVKNAVIVPVGAKGGFVVKQPPASTGDATADREAQMTEGVACYRTFISCLLDITDNRVGGRVVPPPEVVRHDGDDPYLVVAADKGTATFSDIANGVAIDYGFWLGDAFASGGSAGYDHKKMGITARGAWESVKHHFRELGLDAQSQDFTCVGIGDMSGDVFGNGMLLSEHIKLLAAFDHRHVFIDPDPDPVASFAERRRLFALPRSSWGDYDTDLITAGGGIWPRTQKSIPVSQQMRDVLGLAADATAMAPNDLIRAILLAPVDLLWNGGIGTYIKASTETNAQVGDKANDAVRVDGGELRARVVGEGGNLGVSQLGRIEFARAGGKINTDAIDNSAGVDTSDHEVNIKIALQPLLAEGTLTADGRLDLLTAMTEEVASLVLADNTAQNRLLGVSRAHAGPMLSVHARQIDQLAEAGRLDRALEFLPSRAQVDARIATGEGLSSPELSVLVAYTKSALTSDMADSGLPDDPAFAATLADYFPEAMRSAYGSSIAEHPLAREIVTTMAVNRVVNGGGISYAFRLHEEMAATSTDAIRAYVITTTVFDLDRITAEIDAADHVVPAACQDHMTLLVRRLLDRAARWFLTRRPQPLDVRTESARYAGPVASLQPAMSGLLRGVELENVARDAESLLAKGATRDVAAAVAFSLYTFSNLDIADVASDSGRDLMEVAALYYALSAHLDLDRLLTEVTNLGRGDRWHALARQAVRDDLYRSLCLITADVLSTTAPGTDVDDKIAQWEGENASRLGRARQTLAQIAAAGPGDLAALSVAAREIRSMIR